MLRSFGLLVALFSSAVLPLAAEALPLVLSPGTPLEIRLDNKFRVGRLGERVEAHLTRSVFLFDREVVPAGSHLEGRVVQLDRYPTQRRVRAVMSGDFTPFRDPKIQFTRLTTPDGRTIPITTSPTSAQGIVVRDEPDIPSRPRDTTIGKAAEFVRTGFLNARGQIVSNWKSPDRWDRLQEAAYSYLPYHPQYVPRFTQLRVELQQPVPVGRFPGETMEVGSVALPPVDSVVRARLATSVSSRSQPGDRVEAVVSEPLYSVDRKLLLPEGTRLIGSVIKTEKGAYWRRGGALRFAFDSMELPPSVAPERRFYRLSAVVMDFDGAHSGHLRVDAEGEARVVEPLTRFVSPALRLIVGTVQGLDDDQQGGSQPNSSQRTWRTLAGASGFGVLGSVASQASREAATGLGFYGLGWSLFTHVVARGHNVMLPQDTPVKIRLLTGPV